MIADLLKGTVEESLKKLIQPAALVPATLFVLLNLGFIYPAAKSQGAAKAFSTLDETWQAVVAAAVILALGYVLLNAANMIVDALAGQSWRQSGLNWLLRRRQTKRRKRLADRIEREEKENKARLDLRWELATHFPSVNVDKTIQATRLGNALVATQHTVWFRYGLDLAAFWSAMEASKDVKDAPAIVAVKDEKSTLDLLANLVFVLALFGVEGLAFFAARENWRAAALSLLAFVGAYVAYRLAVESARSWGNAIQVVLDLHRGELRKGLGLREPKGLADEQKLWQEARHVYLAGDNEKPPSDLFEAQELPALKITSSAALKVEKAAVIAVDAIADESLVASPAGGASPGTPREAAAAAGEPEPPAQADGDGERGAEPDPAAATGQPQAKPQGQAVLSAADAGLEGFAALLRYVDYSLIASRTVRNGAAGGLDLAVADPRVWRVRVPKAVDVDDVYAEPAVARVGAADELSWRITGLAAGASMRLGFRLPLWRLTLSGDAPRPTLSQHTGRVELRFDPGSANKRLTVELESFAPKAARSPKLTVNGGEEFMDPTDAEQRQFESTEHTLVGNDKLWIELPPS